MEKQYETVIGLEVHVELATKTKIFCGCSTEFGGAPNTHTCPVCAGLPGALPVLNKQVVEYALALGLAANCQINQYCKFDRKNYFYPDNPQNYQISQLYLPICHDGFLEIQTAAGPKKVRIHEMHMEEDAGKLIHDEWDDCSLVDYNRSGVPLIEIVSEPDMRNAQEVIAYLEKLRLICQYLGVSDCKLQEGSMRADVNLSVREVGSRELGIRTEMKNLNSFKAIARAIEGERARQIELLEEGKGKSFLYEQMKGFSDWSSGQTKIPKWREIFDYFGLGEALGPTSAGYKEREEQAGKLLEWLRVYCEKKELSLWEGTRAFLNDGALYGMDLGEIMGEKEESLEGVRLMTLHASKGLEFHRVYLIGMNQGLIPLRCKTMEQEEEERRLFFVGMTRAKEELELSYYVNPREPGVFGEGSRYLLGIPPELLDWEEDVRKGRGEENLRKLGREVREELRRKKEAEKELAPDKRNTDAEPEGRREELSEKPDERETGNVIPVLRVRHRKYGEGILLSQNELTVEVEFPGYGRKQFLKALGEIEFLSQETGETHGK